MPNWCNNTLTLTHDDPAMIDRAVKAFEEGKLLQEFIPCPEPLKQTIAGFMPEGYERELHEFTQQLNVKYFKYSNWYDFNNAEWGTKWDVGNADSYVNRSSPTSAEFGFESAWSPPTAAYEKLQEMGFGVQAYYWEPGMSFCGRHDENGDEYYEVRNLDDAKQLPGDIESNFNIIEEMELAADWDSEE